MTAALALAAPFDAAPADELLVGADVGNVPRELEGDSGEIVGVEIDQVSRDRPPGRSRRTVALAARHLRAGRDAAARTM